MQPKDGLGTSSDIGRLRSMSEDSNRVSGKVACGRVCSGGYCPVPTQAGDEENVVWVGPHLELILVSWLRLLTDSLTILSIFAPIEARVVVDAKGALLRMLKLVFSLSP